MNNTARSARMNINLIREVFREVSPRTGANDQARRRPPVFSRIVMHVCGAGGTAAEQEKELRSS